MSDTDHYRILESNAERLSECFQTPTNFFQMLINTILFDSC